MEEVLAKPGIFSQMCMLVPAKSKAELPLFGFGRDWAQTRISVENFRRLRGERAAVVIETAKALDSARGERLELCLMVLLDLNGVEALPVLLRLEDRLGGVPPTSGEHAPRVQVLSVITALLKNEQAPGLERLGQKGHNDEATRDLIVELAQNYVKSGVARRGAKAMTAEPVVR